MIAPIAVPIPQIETAAEEDALGRIWQRHRKEVSLSRSFAFAGISLKYKSGDAGYFSEPAFGKFCRIEAGKDIFNKLVDTKKSLLHRFGKRRCGSRKQFNAIIVYRPGERQGLKPCKPVGEVQRALHAPDDRRKDTGRDENLPGR